MKPCIATVAVGGALLLGGGQVSGFVQSQVGWSSFVSKSSPFSSKTSLFATQEESILIVKKGLKWILVPNARSPPKRASASQPAASSPSVEVSDTAVVDTPPTQPLQVVETPPVVVEAPPVVAEAQVIAPPTAPIAMGPPPVEAVPIITSPASFDVVSVLPEPVVPETSYPYPAIEILPKADGVSSAGSVSMDFEQMIQALRENHWAKMPQIQDTVSPVDEKAPVFADFLKAQGEANLAVVMKGAPGYLQDSSEAVKNKLSVMIDPNLFQALKEKMAEATSGIDLEELGQYFKENAINKMPDMGSLQGSLQQYVNTDQITIAAASYKTFAASLSAIKSTIDQANGKLAFDDIVNAMNLKETGSWYFGAGTLLFLMALSAANTGSSSASYRKVIYTEAAMPVKSEQALASVVVEPISKEQDLVGAQVAMLKNATDDIYSRLNEMFLEKQEAAYEVATMKSELRNVVNKLDANMEVERDLRMSLENTQKAMQKDTAFLREELEKRIAAEAELRDQLAATEEKLAKEMVKVKRAKLEAEEEVARAQEEVQMLRQEKDDMEAEIMFLRSEMKNLQKQLPKPKEESPVLQANSFRPTNGISRSDNGSQAESNVATLPKPTVLRASSPYDSLKGAFFAAIADSPTLKQSTAQGVQEATRPSGSKKLVVKITSRKLADFSKLSAVALNNKTVKELTDYLESKGTPTAGPGGKQLEKENLIEMIMSQ